MAVAFVVVLVMVFVMLPFFVVVLVMVFVMLAFLFVVVLFFVFRHGQVVGASFTVEFVGVFCMFCQQVHFGRARSCEIATQLIDEKCLKVEGFHASRHGVRCGGKGRICSHGVEGFVDPRLETKPVIEEHVRRLQADQVLR